MSHDLGDPTRRIKVPPRRFLSWRRDNKVEELGRVELVPFTPIRSITAERNLVHTLEDATIPAGCVLTLIEVDV